MKNVNISNNSSASSTGIGFLGLLCVALVVLKLLGKITISWWLVFAPIWAPFIIALIVFGGLFIIFRNKW